MEDFNINKVDFLHLDIDKYLDWLLNKYNLFSEIHELEYLNEEINSLHARKYFANSHYIKTRNITIPENIETAYTTRIKAKEIEKERFKNIEIHELIFFDSVEYTKRKESRKEYGFFNKNELKNISIDNSYLKAWFNNDYGNAFIDETTNRLTSSPLKENTFYQKELNFLLENYDFEYLPQILNGLFIYNLDNEKNALSFAVEIDKIKLAIYLTEKITGETAKHPLTKPIQWTGQLNTLVTIFNELLTADLIKGTKENIKRILINNFINANGLELSKNSIDEILNPSKMKADKKTADLLRPLLEHLAKK